MPATAKPSLAPVTTTSALPISGLVLHGLKRTLGYAELLLKDIPAESFGRMPHPTMNHPAFIIGHLSLYPDRLFNMIGRKNLVKEKPGWQEMFQAGAACVEQDGRYPHKDELVSHYQERYLALAEILPTLSDEVFSRENPMEGRIKEMFPLVGHAFNFMCNNHQMMHLGQISAWRRAMGLGGVM